MRYSGYYHGPCVVFFVLVVLVSTILASARSDQTTSFMEEILAYISDTEQESRYINELKEIVKIPSISADPEHHKDVLAASDWFARRLETAGFQNVTFLDNASHRPAVYGEYIVDQSLPTALIYGHYDVQPASPVAAWSHPPFDPVVNTHANIVSGRGASDDKGCVLGPIQAIEAILKTTATLPFNIKILIEGEEEIGSPNLEPFLELYAPHTLACDFVISADGGQLSPTQPMMSLGLRGAAAAEVEVSCLSRDVHSGMYGGAVQNAIRALTHLLASMHDPITNKVLVKGFYDKVRNISAADWDDILAMNFDDAANLVDGIGALEPTGEDGFSSLERIWLRPTLEFVGIDGGYSGTGIKTVLPAKALAKLSARLVPDQDHKEILKLIEDHIERHHPKGCNVTVRELGFKAAPFVTDRNSVPNAALARVLKYMYGKAPLHVRGGATIPAMAGFQKYLKAETTTLAFALPTDRVHAPDEHFNLGQYSLSREAYVRYIFELGKEIRAGNLVKKKEKQPSTTSDRSEL